MCKSSDNLPCASPLNIQPEERKQKLMAVLFVCYKTPADAAAFDSYYAATHIPLVQKAPGRENAISAPGRS
jgi:hypothetical protein